MSEPIELDIFTRCHTVLPPKPCENPNGEAGTPKWPPYICSLDDETTEDLELAFEFGAYQFCKLTPAGYVVEEEGLIFADNLDEHSLSVLQDYARKHGLKLRSRRNFVEHVVWPTLRAGGALVGFNLGFDISRIAPNWTSREDGTGFTFYVSDYWNRKRKRWEINRFRPGIVRTSIDSRKSFYSVGFTEGTEEENKEYRRGRFIDVRTLAFALTNTSHSLESLCKALAAPKHFGKSEYVSGPITPKKIRYCLRDVVATIWCLNKLREEFEQHPIPLQPDRAYSPVSFSKSYLADGMRIVIPLQKSDISPSVLGAVMEGFYAGRTECKARRTPLPVVYCDLTSAYPTVNALQENWTIVIAESITIEDCTQELQELLEEIARDPLRVLLDKRTWPKLRGSARIKPDGSGMLPIRAKYDDESQNIGFNYLKGDRSIYYEATELATSVLLTGSIPAIESAFKVVPHGTQSGLRPTTIRGEVPVDPINDDFNRLLIEKRLEIKKENPTLAQFLKTTANGGAAYGMFVQVDPHTEDEEVLVKVFSGHEQPFASVTADLERGGPWYFPNIGAAVTAGTHLLLALVERLVTDAGGVYALMDTDSAAIISTREGGLVPCPGGPHRLPDGRNAIHALSWEEVRTKVVEPLRALNPYRGEAGKGSILKIEDINFGPDGNQRQLFIYGIASKRYSMFVENERGEREIVKASAHGLGYLYPPFDDKQREHAEHQWIWDAWDYILTLELDGPEAARAKRKPYFDLPAMMPVAITTPTVIARFKGQAWARPLNFMLAPLLLGEISNGGEAKLAVVTPFTKDRSAWKRAIYRDVATGDCYTLYDEHRPSKPRQLDVMCYGGIIEQHRFHPEPKFCGPDGQPCGPETRGILQRRHVQIGRKIPIRKEGNRRWQEGEDPSILQGYELEVDSTATEYVRAKDRCNHRSHTVASAQLRDWLKKVSLSLICKITGIKREHLRAIRDGRPARKKTLATLESLKRRWINAEQSGSLQHAIAAIRSGGW